LQKWARSRTAIAVLSGCWLVAIVLGMRALLAHEFGAGKAAVAPERWPPSASVRLDPTRPTLVMLAHPRCPCTRASVAELARLMRRLGDRATAHVLFVRPAGTAPDFTNTDTWASAARIPGVEVHVDERGRDAALFGAKTSGQVVLYGADGKLEFAGGITPTRGHEGDSVGFDRVVGLVSGRWAARVTSAVFGCSLGEDP
jgi:hypothetical protein